MAYRLIGCKAMSMVGRGGLEPPTSRLSGVRSNHLSYRPSKTGGTRCLELKRYVDGLDRLVCPEGLLSDRRPSIVND